MIWRFRAGLEAPGGLRTERGEGAVSGRDKGGARTALGWGFSAGGDGAELPACVLQTKWKVTENLLKG